MALISVGIVGVLERRQEIRKLVASLNSPLTAIHWDINHRGSWYGHLNALLFYRDCNSTHHLVIEDDVEVCDHFMDILNEAVEAVPDQVISIYSARAEKAKTAWALKHDSSWFRNAHGASGQGVLFPRHLLDDFLVWERRNCPAEMKYEDTRLYGWMNESGLLTWNTVPSLIEHTQPMQSMLGFNNQGKVAAWYEKHPPVIDWRKGLPSPKVFKYIGGIKGYTINVVRRRENG